VKRSDQIYFLYTNIGRGHPFYLDGLLEQLRYRERSDLSLNVSDVFAQSRGISRIAWRAVRWLYHNCSFGLMGRLLYDRLRHRNNYNRASLGLKFLGWNLQSFPTGKSGPLVVAHPILSGIYRELPGLVYQHGELVVPDEALVAGAGTVLVPTAEVAQRFLNAGYDPTQVVVTGLCIESALVAGAEVAYRNRQARLSNDAPLTGLFLSSGAEPPPHVEQIAAGISSVVKAGGYADVLVRHGGRLDRALASMKLPDSVRRHFFSKRHEEAELSTELVAKADYLVAPSHERTNWAVGLGLPMFVLTPTIGSFAPLNLALIERSGVGEAIRDMTAAADLGSRLTELHRTGQLTQMSERGWGRHDIDGFARGADLLVRLIALD